MSHYNKNEHHAICILVMLEKHGYEANYLDVDDSIVGTA